MDDVPLASARNPNFELRLMARVLSGLFGAGATLTLATVLLPSPATADERGLLTVIVLAFVVAAVFYTLADRVPAWSLSATIAWGTASITAVAYFSGESPSPLIFFYLWIFLYSAYFFSKRVAILQLVLVGVSYGVLLAISPPDNGVAWWLVGIGTLLVAAGVIAAMRVHADRLILRLHGAARTDPLTLLSNRRGFREQLDLELERARRGGNSLTVVVGDIDHFKQVNDRSGHHAGDVTLIRVSELLRAGKRRIDSVARIGGEEFALLIPDASRDDAMVVAERLRVGVRNEFTADPVPITISFGIAEYPTHGETAGSLLRAVDEALYEAKESGRNRTVVHSDGLRGVGGSRDSARDVEGERFVAVMLSFAEAVDVRFSGTARHSETVGRYAEMMARQLGLSEQRVGRVRLAGMLHDIGKAGIPDSILHKAGKLTDAEFAQIRTHPDLGAQFLEHECLEDVRAWVRAHHERPDGRGYPLGLSGEEIPLEARIVAVADAFEAMTSDRSYRSAIGLNAAHDELRACAGGQFDPEVVEAFIVSSAVKSRQIEADLAPA